MNRARRAGTTSRVAATELQHQKEKMEMRVNVYAEEMTEKVEIISKEIDGHKFTGLRFYLELPATVNGEQHQGPFIHRPGDDDSSAVTFWGKQDLRTVLIRALDLLDTHYATVRPGGGAMEPAISSLIPSFLQLLRDAPASASWCGRSHAAATAGGGDITPTP